MAAHRSGAVPTFGWVEQGGFPLPKYHLSAQAVRIPVAKPTRISTRLLDKRDYLLVSLTSDQGSAVGIGYSYAGTIGGRILVAIVEEILEPVVAGCGHEGIVEIWERMYQETLLMGRRGAVLRAMSAIDIAFWDLTAKQAGMPLSTVLGGAPGPAEAYASGGYYRAEDGPWAEAVADEIRFNQSLGFRDHKIKVGGLAPELDAERVAAAIETIDGQGRLALDANNAYPTVQEAARVVRIFEKAAGDHSLWWIEEPLSPDDFQGHVALSQRVETPVATGEIAQTRWEFSHLLDREAELILQPDAGVIGGVTEWMRVARTAETLGLVVAPHWHANLHVQLASATSNCLTVEHFVLEKDIYNFELLVTPETRTQVVDGSLVASSRVGIGIELDQDAVARYSLTAGT
jgi:L-alanine-DL-glutamate epimerase-like enolase superfamily enzyme